MPTGCYITTDVVHEFPSTSANGIAQDFVSSVVIVTMGNWSVKFNLGASFFKISIEIALSVYMFEWPETVALTTRL